MVSPPSPDFIPQESAGPVALASDSPEMAALCTELGLAVAADDGRCPLLPPRWHRCHRTALLGVDCAALSVLTRSAVWKSGWC